MDITAILQQNYQYVYIVAFILGMIGHYAKKKVKNETEADLAGWFSHQNIFASIATFVTAAITLTGTLANNLITADMSIMTILYTGLTAGIAVDSVANSD